MKLTSRRSALGYGQPRYKWTCVLLFCLGLTGSLSAQAPVPSGKPLTHPDWWFEWEVIRRTNSAEATPSWPGSYPAADDFGALSQGQLKNLAWAAYQHFEADYPGGGGPSLDLHVAGFVDPVTGDPAVDGTTDDFAATNLGQLKHMVFPFYERLLEIGYLVELPSYLIPDPNQQNYAAANIGQAKNLFSFDLALDTDGVNGQGDGLPDWWETHYFTDLDEDRDGDADGDGWTNLEEFQRATTPLDFFNGQPPVISIASGNNQGNLPGQFLVHPIVTVVRNIEGTLFKSRPGTIVFTVLGGGSELSISNTGMDPLQNTLTVSTDSEGRAQAFIKLPATLGPAVTIEAKVTNQQGQSASVVFTATIGDSDAAPQGANGVIVTRQNENEILVRWTDLSDNETGFRIYRRIGTGTFTEIGGVGANVTEFTDTGAPEYDTNVPPSKVLYTYYVAAVNTAASVPVNQQSAPSIPATTDPHLDEDNDRLANGVEVQLGLDPNKLSTDNDGVPDDIDGAPLMDNFAPKRLSAPRSLVLDLGVSEDYEAQFINNKGQVILSNESNYLFWEKGVTTEIPLPHPDTHILITDLNNNGIAGGYVFSIGGDEPWRPDWFVGDYALPQFQCFPFINPPRKWEKFQGVQ